MKRVLFALTLIISTVHVKAQVGIGTENPKATLDVTAVQPKGTGTNVEGVLIPRVDRERAQSMRNVEKSTMIYVDEVTTGIQTETAINIDTEGFYYFDGTVWVKISSGNSTPGFFYMPSIVLPTINNDARILDTSNLSYSYDAVTATYTVKLYDLFKAQFNVPVATSSSVSGLKEFVLDSDKYDYFVTFADNSVFTDIKINSIGILTYKTAPNAIIRNGSFMNIVLKVK
ncbi:hypothetical protein [Empedobacter brevis]|uniref:hypothetical protein n=1 Tax=Empedobacter brevis TaxID=247 RepID=UPI00289EC29F|nr:hypothetical protein [Empedobacter brevis]